MAGGSCIKKICLAVVGILCFIVLLRGWIIHGNSSPRQLSMSSQHQDNDELLKPARGRQALNVLAKHDRKHQDTKYHVDDLQNKNQISTLYRSTCPTGDTTIYNQKPWIQFKSIVLVILFNNPIYKNIPVLEMIYRPFFPTIIYCISNYEKQQELVQWNLTIISYKSRPKEAGFQNYICVDYVHQLGLKADGFFFLADDTLVSLPALARFSKNPLPAITHSLPKYVCDTKKPAAHCFKYGHYKHASREMTSLRHTLSKTPNDTLGLKCDQNLQKLTGVKNPLTVSPPDIYYIPASYMQDASHLFRLYHAHDVFLEVALLHVFACLSYPQPPFSLTGKHMFGPDRGDLTKMAPHVVSGGAMWVHPFKLSPLVKRETKYVKYFCETFIPFLHQEPKHKGRS